MSDIFCSLYETLLNGIENIEKNNPDQKKQIEQCFHLCETIRRKVDRTLADTKFESEEKEIAFFKTIKPQFTHLVEFYSILYRAELFIPDTKTEQEEFWNAELQRAEQFIERHINLFNYIKGNDTSNDRKYFLRDEPDATSAMHCELIARLLAREKYIDYIKTNIFPRFTSVNL